MLLPLEPLRCIMQCYSIAQSIIGVRFRTCIHSSAHFMKRFLHRGHLHIHPSNNSAKRHCGFCHMWSSIILLKNYIVLIHMQKCNKLLIILQYTSAVIVTSKKNCSHYTFATHGAQNTNFWRMQRHYLKNVRVLRIPNTIMAT